MKQGLVLAYIKFHVTNPKLSDLLMCCVNLLLALSRARCNVLVRHVSWGERPIKLLLLVACEMYLSTVLQKFYKSKVLY